jgi:hypothetical protein
MYYSNVLLDYHTPIHFKRDKNFVDRLWANIRRKPPVIQDCKQEGSQTVSSETS